MRKSFQYLAAFLLANIVSIAVFAQTTTIQGNVKNSVSGEVVSAASVTVKGSGAGSFTDDNGNFKLVTSQKFPLTLIISSVGFELQEVNVSSAGEMVQVSFKPSSTLGQEVVIAATRIPTRILESPVSIERVNLPAIRNSISPSYYDVIGNLKGVDMTTSSFSFRTPSTRGFNGSGNLRFNQLVDGMDNQAPALNFAVGSIIGLTELDVENMELLPGASSALYGSGGMNGTLLIGSKSPFKYQGFSFQVKEGVNHIDQYERTLAPFYDWSFRWAKKVSEKFAFKLGAQLVQAKDWQGTDIRDLQRNNIISSLKPGGTRGNDPNYDGVNVFGDEASASMQAFSLAVRQQLINGGGGGVTGAVDAYLNAGLTPAQILATFNGNPALAPYAQYLPFIIPTSTVTNNPYRGTYGFQAVSRTGYNEKDLVNYNAYNIRYSLGANYRITENLEASFLGYYGNGTSVYTGADRYSLKNLKMGQYKLELKSKNWFVRGYTTQENSGDAYTATTAALYVNRAWKSDANWFQQYTATYGSARLAMTGPQLSDSLAHAVARANADAGRLVPGTVGYMQAFNNAINTNISSGGAKFADKSSLYHYEGQYNLTEALKFAEVQVGASYRQYVLNSQGTIFADTAGKIRINEYGAYVQVSKKIINDALKLTGSVRYDKNDNFDGRFTPRLTALLRVFKDNNIRLSYQTAYRFPSTQDQYINLLTGGANRLIGGLPQFNTFFGFNTNPAYTVQSILDYRNSFGAGAPNPGLLVVAPFTNLKAETMESYEAGYKGLITKKLLVDVYYYYSKYKNFIARAAVGRGSSGIPANAPVDLASPFTTNNYSFVVNSSTPVKGTGWGIGVDYNIFRGGYMLSLNASGDVLKDVPSGLVTFFNTPKWRYNIGFSNSDFYKGWGFSANWREQDDVNWEGTFGTGLVPQYVSLDASISYKIKSIKSLIKFGSTNFMNHYYRSAFGNPEVGGLYYVSFGYNVF